MNGVKVNRVDSEQERVPECPMIPTGKPKIREIIIKEVNGGYIVSVGCHTFAFSTKDELTTTLLKYINEPEEIEKKWFSGDLF